MVMIVGGRMVKVVVVLPTVGVTTKEVVQVLVDTVEVTASAAVVVDSVVALLVEVVVGQ